MKTRAIRCSLFAGVIFAILPIGMGAQGFNLNKMMQGMQPSAPPSQKSDKQKSSGGGFGNLLKGGGSVPGGSFGGNKGAPAGMLGTPSPGGSAAGQNSGKDYSQGSIVSLLCEVTKDPKELYAGSGKGTNNEWQIKVAKDFGKKTGPEVQAIFNESGGASSTGWAGSLKSYLAKDGAEGAFNGTHINRLLENFTERSNMRGTLAGKIKRAIFDENLDDTDKADAKFAYALILGHYNKQHKKQGYADSLLKSAWESEVLGAMYVRGLRIYKGFGVPKNIDGAQNYVFAAFQKVQDLIEKAEEDGEPMVDRWAEPEILWTQFATDTNFSGHGRFKSLAKSAAKMRASIEEDMKKKSGTQTAKEIEKLERIRLDAEKRLADAFGIANKIARERSAEDLNNQSNKDSMVVEKYVSVSEESSNKLAAQIASSEKDLNPKGLKAVAGAHDRVRYVVGQSGRLISSFMSTGLSGGIGEMVKAAKSAGLSLKLACNLNNAVVTYKKKKSLSLDVSDKLEEGDELEDVKD
jgi:hypothetical protein